MVEVDEELSVDKSQVLAKDTIFGRQKMKAMKTSITKNGKLETKVGTSHENFHRMKRNLNDKKRRNMREENKRRIVTNLKLLRVIEPSFHVYLSKALCLRVVLH